MNFKKNLSNFITLLNLASGFISIIFAINEKFVLSASFIIAAAVFDYFDGKIARYFNIESDLGADLDSLSDLVSFGVAPAIMNYVLFKNNLLVFFALIFVLCGAFRLASFNVLKSKVKGFVGMPITINGIIFPVLYFANATLLISCIVFIVSSLLMISAIHFDKVK